MLVNVERFRIDNRSPQAHVPTSLADTCQPRQYRRRRDGTLVKRFNLIARKTRSGLTAALGIRK
jgi:hypothetical protein